MSRESRATPVVGFNHNVTHGGRIFHVQTEDSGSAHAHIMTHVYLGGNIVASSRSSYADRVTPKGAADLPAVVRKLMEEQHKAMVRALLSGDHDAEIARRTAEPIYQPGVLASGEQAALLVGGQRGTPSPAVAPKAPPLTGPAPRLKPLDERVLDYLVADLDAPRR